MDATTNPVTATHCVAYDSSDASDKPLNCGCETCEGNISPEGRMLHCDCAQACRWLIDWSPSEGLSAELVGRDNRHLGSEERITVGRDVLVRRWGKAATDAIEAIEEHLYWYRAWATDAVDSVPAEFCARPATEAVFADEIDPAIRAAYRARYDELLTSPLRPRRYEPPTPTVEELAKWIA